MRVHDIWIHRGCESPWSIRISRIRVKEVLTMAKCAVCGKSVHFGNRVSHSHRRSNKMWKPNIKSIRVKVNGGTKKMPVCTGCLRSGAVERA